MISEERLGGREGEFLYKAMILSKANCTVSRHIVCTISNSRKLPYHLHEPEILPI